MVTSSDIKVMKLISPLSFLCVICMQLSGNWCFFLFIANSHCWDGQPKADAVLKLGTGSTKTGYIELKVANTSSPKH